MIRARVIRARVLRLTILPHAMRDDSTTDDIERARAAPNGSARGGGGDV